jgi:hypothetical protein
MVLPTHPRLVPLYGVPARESRVSVAVTRSTLLGHLGSHRSGLALIRFTGRSSPGPRRDDLMIYWALGPFVRSFILSVDPGDTCPPHPRRPFPASRPRPCRPSLQSHPCQRRVPTAHLSHLFLSLALLMRRRSVGCRLSCLLARPLFMAMVDEGGKGEAQPPGLDPRTRRSVATRATGDMDGGGRGEEWEAPPATCSRSRRRRCPFLSPSPA